MPSEMILNLFIHGRGHHEAAWRHPKASLLPLSDIRYFQGLAQRAEEGLFDSIFLADQLALGPDVDSAPRTWLEPLTALGALAASTTKIGLIATASTTYTEPYNLVRQLASLDHISNGRIGWNVVTSWSVPAAGNYGDAAQVSHDIRYAKAREYIELAKALWASWDADVILDDRAAGRYARADGIRPVNHKGDYYAVTGPLNVPQSRQGRPVLVQAGSSETGRDFAATHAEAIFTAHLEKAAAQAFYQDIKARVRQKGRPENQALVLPGFSPMIGATEEEAQRLTREINDLADPEVGRTRMSGRFGGHDFSHLPMDKPLSPEDFPDPDTVQAARSRTAVIVDLVRREQPTLRQLLSKLAGARGHFTYAGTPEQVADLMQDWIEDDAADGFNLMPPVLPYMLDVFIDEVVPILQKRGLFKTAYRGETLRDHYHLNRP